MSYEDYYEQEPSECDEIIDEAVVKLTDIIKERAKDNIDSVLKADEKKDSKIKSLEATIAEQEKVIGDKNKEIAELQKKRDEIPAFPFQLGEKVWTENPEYRELKCPTCEGSGEIHTDIAGVKYSAKCPLCRGNRWSSGRASVSGYPIYSPKEIKITTIKYTVSEDSQSTVYYSAEGKDYTDVYSSSEECLKMCEKLTAESLAKAQKRLNGEDA